MDVHDRSHRAWNDLESPWRLCLSLAWEAYAAQTIPVGAVLVDGQGAVVATGRNRVHEPTAPAGEIARSRLAHAEINALLGLRPDRRYRDHILYSSLEPCLLCVGAAHRSTVGTVRYAGAEPFRGADPRFIGAALRGGERVVFEGPLEGPFGRLAGGLAVAFFLDGVHGDADELVACAEREVPALAATARSLSAGPMARLARGGVALADALAELWPALQADPAP